MDINNISKINQQGISIDIQGKTSQNYTVRISGIKSKNQMNTIVLFINVLFKFYYNVFVKRNNFYFEKIVTLSQISLIAQYKNDVIDIVKNTDDDNADADNETDNVNYNVDDRTSKKQTFKTKDKNRLSFRPLKGQN